MQSLQLTNDAGYKFELWRKLLADSSALSSSSSSSAVPPSVQAAITRVALPLVQQQLPRRVREPCCLAGSCVTPSVPFCHRSVQLGRHRIETSESCRDELCFCLAHATACAGPAVDLTVHGYYASGNDMRNRYRGLRCLLRHTRAGRIHFDVVDNQNDARALAVELAHLLEQQPMEGCWRELCLTRCSFDTISFRGLLSALQRVDCLTHVSLEGVHVGSCAPIAALVQHTATLTHLSVRGSTVGTEWATVAEAVASAPSIVHLNVAACNWQDAPHLADFTASLQSFVPRQAFALDLSSNLLTSRCFGVLASADVSFTRCVTELFLGGHIFTNDAEAVSTVLSGWERLTALSVRRCTLSPAVAQRVVRALGDKKREWRLVDVAYTNLPANTFKRLCQANFASADAALCCSGVNLHGQITKAGFASCAAVLSRLELSYCSLTDECIAQLAAALEKAAPLPLRHLSVSQNVGEKTRVRGDGGFLFLCKALRAHVAPLLTTVDLAGNRLPLLPLAALIEQASQSLRMIDLSTTSIADAAADRARVLTTLMRRQRGASPFVVLDVYFAASVADPPTGLKEVTEWLATQTSVRLLLAAPRRSPLTPPPF